MRPITSRLEDLPSWVPDWSQRFKTAALRELNRQQPLISLYRASGDTQAEIEYLAPGKLHVKGVLLDKIKKVGTIHKRARIFNGDIVKNWQQETRVYHPEDPETMYSPKYQSLRRCLTEDICYGVGGIEGKPEEVTLVLTRGNNSRDRFMYEFWQHELNKKEVKSRREDPEENKELIDSIRLQDLVRYGDFVSMATFRRRLIVTEQGGIGFGPAEAEVGDQLCCLYGGKSPYILRKSSQTKIRTFFKKSLRSYRLVGDAFIDGLMDGEIIDLVSKGHLESEYIILE